MRILRSCFSKIVYLFYYHDVAHSFIHGDFSAYKKTPNKSFKKCFNDLSDKTSLNKVFKNIFKEDEQKLLYPEKKNNFVLFLAESKNSHNLKTILCIYYLYTFLFKFFLMKFH